MLALRTASCAEGGLAFFGHSAALKKFKFVRFRSLLLCPVNRVVAHLLSYPGIRGGKPNAQLLTGCPP